MRVRVTLPCLPVRKDEMIRAFSVHCGGRRRGESPMILSYDPIPLFSFLVCGFALTLLAFVASFAVIHEIFTLYYRASLLTFTEKIDPDKSQPPLPTYPSLIIINIIYGYGYGAPSIIFIIGLLFCNFY